MNRANRVLGPRGPAWLAVVIAMGSSCSRPRAVGRASAEGGVGSSVAGLSSEQAGQVLARVGDKAITLGDYAATLDRMDQFDRLRYESPERRKELLQEIVDFELLADEARRRHLDEKPEVKQSVRQILRDALLAEAHRGLPAPGEIPIEEARAYFDAHRGEFREPERRRASHILMRDAATAEHVIVLARRASGQEWGELVSKYSIAGPKAGAPKLPLELMGDLGIVGPPGDPRGDNPRVPEAVRRAVFEIGSIGGVADKPAADEQGFHVVRLTGKSEARERTFEDSERTIRVALVQARIAERDRALEAELRAKFPVAVDEAGLASGDGPSTSGSAGAPPGSRSGRADGGRTP